MSTDSPNSGQVEATLERAGLVRLCARLTGNVDVAEDLSQETLLEAWPFVETSVAMFFSPAERALLPRLVREDHLIPANALTGLNDNLACLAGPPVGGALLGFLGLGSVAIVDGASFLIAAVLISLM